MWYFLLFCGACCSSSAPLSFYPGAICTCVQTDLPVPALSCQSVCRAGRGCCLWLILDLPGSTNFWRSATKHGAFSIVGAEKWYVVRVLDSKSMQISVWEVRFTSKAHYSPVFVASVYLPWDKMVTWYKEQLKAKYLAILPPVFSLQLGSTCFKLGGSCLQRICTVIQLRELLVSFQHFIHIDSHDVYHLKNMVTFRYKERKEKRNSSMKCTGIFFFRSALYAFESNFH